ncbi:MAG: FkbM family methyltransferase [Ginsengibacter sp.]
MSVNKFIVHIAAEFVKAVNNNFEDNYDYNRYGELLLSKRKKLKIKQKAVKKVNELGFFNNFNNTLFANKIKDIEFPFGDFFYLYDILEDDYSKELLVKIIAYRILGHTKVKLPLSTPAFWNDQKRIESHQHKDDFTKVGFMDLMLPLTDLSFMGVPIKIYYSSLGINIDFVIKQYELHRDGVVIRADAGDVVLDCGGCFGDTALYFANLVGGKGKVKTFEFIPNNIQVFNKNIGINPALATIIELVSNPVWKESGKEVFFLDNGPASRVSLDFFEAYTGKTTTLTIDDFVDSSGLKKVDFIKMDIEGSETNALKGATETIKKFRPKLAIAVYHSSEDFDSIPRFIDSLGAGYKFYLSHATIYGEETMLFAKAAK